MLVVVVSWGQKRSAVGRVTGKLKYPFSKVQNSDSSSFQIL